MPTQQNIVQLNGPLDPAAISRRPGSAPRHAAAKTLCRNCLVLFLSCLLAACGAARLGYQNGEFVSYWWLNSYIDIDSDQASMVKKHIATLFNWHHKTQVKEYAQFLTEQQKRLQRIATKADLLADNAEIKQHLQILADRALPELADLAMSLHPQQISYLEKKFSSNNDTYRKENLRGDIEKRQRFRFKKAMQQAEYWFGDFSREQEAQIRAASDARPLNNEMVMADRQQRQRDLLALLRKILSQKPTRDAVMAMLKDYLNNSFFDRPGIRPELKAFLDASRDSNAQMEAMIINLATPEQKARAVKKAQQWIDDFNNLANPV